MRKIRLPIARALAALVALSPAAFAQPTGSTQSHPRFTVSGQHPDEFEIVRDSTVAHGGHTSIRFHIDDDPSGFATIATTLPASPYLGRRVRFSVYVRAASLGGGGGQLWARADGVNQPGLAFVNSLATPFRGTKDWTQLCISLDVPQTAARVFVGAQSLGAGTLWVDDAHIEADGVAPADYGFETLDEFTAPPFRRAIVAREAPRALTPRGLANVSAFANALGYVRFFHPSDAAVNVNWDAFAVHGVRAVESATSPDSLAAALTTVFAPVTSGVRFARTGVPLPTTIPKPDDATHVVFWRHLGVGAPSGGAPSNPQSVYRSERVIAGLSEIGRPVALAADNRSTVSLPPVPDPSHPMRIELGGGVTMSMPIALFTHSDGIDESLRVPRPTTVDERFPASDRASRLASVALAWSLFTHFYPYFDVVHTDWPAALDAALRTAATDAGGDAFQGTLERLVAALHDGHGQVYRPSASMSSPDVQFGWAEGRVLVTAVGDSAAARGLHVGDEVLTVEGRPIQNELAERSTRISGATPQWIRERALDALLLADPDSRALIRVRGANGATRDVSLSRTPMVGINAKTVDKVAELSPRVMYVDLSRITDADFDAAMPRLQQASAVIFDMRGYPRASTPKIFAHLTDTVIHSAHFMTPVITLPNYENVGFIDGAWTIAPQAPRLNARIVFLSGGGAISYAESTLGVVEAYRLGDIVGEASAGTNGNVNPFLLPGGFNVMWTGMLVQKRDGTPHHGVGIKPTVPASPTVAGIRAGRDDVLERAVALVTTRVVP